jgi:lactoylglutathione lyase
LIDHFNAYVLVVHDLEKCVSFYRDILGLQLKSKEDDFAYLVFRNQAVPGVAVLSIDSAAKNISEAQIQRRDKGTYRTYFAVFLEDVDEEYESLKSKGVHFIKPPTTYPWGQRIAYFEDPEGNLWEISHFPKK